MSGIPNEIPEFGDSRQKPRQNPEFAPGVDFGTDDYFVWSRCDGTVSLRDIILMVGFGTNRCIEILAKLRQLGAVLLEGEDKLPESLRQTNAEATAPASKRVTRSSKPVPRAPRTSKPPPAAPATPPPAAELSDPSPEESEALGLDLPLAHNLRIRILEFRRRLPDGTHFDVLEVEPDSDKRSVKRAYFRLSKEFHPDRHYGKDLGPFGDWLHDVFKAVTAAFKVLGDNKKRAEYEASLRGDSESQQPQTKAEHAQQIFQSACNSELHGDTEQALKLFAASIRMDENPRFLRRAAMCAVQARELSVAEEYAKKAAHLCGDDGSILRVLADVYRAGAQLEKAQEVLERAVKLDTENDILFGELRSDLAAVESAMAEKLAAEDGR